MRTFRSSRAAQVAALCLATLVPIAVQGSAAIADVPDAPVEAPFNAPLCPGATDYVPTNNEFGVIPDLTLVFGGRLDTYNAGGVVALYDDYGLQDPGSYPPLCGTRYVASVDSAVSEWMYCTDRSAHVCGGTNSDGDPISTELVPDQAPIQTVVAPILPLPAANPKLSPDQEKLIAWLIQHGHSYAGVGDQAWHNVDIATDGPTSTTDTRAALQTLVWCISDPTASVVTDFGQTCAANMDAAEQARLLALIPDTPTLTIEATSPTATVGDVARFELITNVYTQPITLGIVPASAISLCPGESDAVLTDGELTVAGADAAASTQVDLCVTVTEEPTAIVTASVTPPTTSHIGWNQSAGAEGVSCQVFASFKQDDAVVLSDDASVAVAAVATTTTTTTTTTVVAETTTSSTQFAVTTSSSLAGGVPSVPGTLPATGRSSMTGLTVALFAMVVGVLALFAARRPRLH